MCERKVSIWYCAEFLPPPTPEYSSEDEGDTDYSDDSEDSVIIVPSEQGMCMGIICPPSPISLLYSPWVSTSTKKF